MKTIYTPVLAILISTVLFPAVSAHGAPPPRYTVTDLGTIPGGSYPAVAYGINNRGQIVGHALGSNLFYRPFIYEMGVMREIPAGTNGGFAGPINDLGQVLGTFDTAYDPLTKGRDNAFLYSNGAVIDLSIVHGAYLRGVGINNLGQFVGFAEKPDGSLNSFIYSNAVAHFPTFNIQADFYAINDRGQILGVGLYPTTNLDEPSPRATIFQDGSYQDLGLLPGSLATYGTSLNNLGDAVGYSSQLPDQRAHGFVYMHGRMMDAGTLPGDVASFLWSINDSRVAVGMSRIPDERARAIIWQHNKLEDLNDLIPSNSGWTLVEARAINNLGQIVGTGLINGEYHPFLLAPVRPGNKK